MFRVGNVEKNDGYGEKRYNTCINLKKRKKKSSSKRFIYAFSFNSNATYFNCGIPIITYTQTCVTLNMEQVNILRGLVGISVIHHQKETLRRIYEEP